jgi:hypothetical protein
MKEKGRGVFMFERSTKNTHLFMGTPTPTTPLLSQNIYLPKTLGVDITKPVIIAVFQEDEEEG